MRAGLLFLTALLAGALSVDPLERHSPIEPPASLERRSLSPPPPRPVWPAAYSVAFDFFTPYISKLQGAPFSVHVEIDRDDRHGLQRIIRGGTETCVERLEDDTRYYVIPYNGPEADTACFADHIGAGGGPVRRALRQWSAGGLSNVLPNITESRWHYRSTHKIKHVLVHSWSYHVSHSSPENGRMDVDWEFHVTPEGVPVRMDMTGLNFISGGHYDQYSVDFHHFRPTPPDPAVFEVPAACEDADVDHPDHMSFPATARLHRITAARLFPSPHHGDAEYDGFAAAHRRSHTSATDYEARRDLFQANKAVVADHNAGGGSPSYRLSLNRFGDWHEEEYLALFQQPVDLRDEDPFPPPPVQALNYSRSVPEGDLPPTVDWRGSPADSPVKDQDYCGSCWAFSATAAMEAAHFRTFGVQRLLSEQRLLDCGWKYGARGCFGGLQSTAFSFGVLDGMVAQEELLYTSVDGVCRTDVTPVVQLSHYLNIAARDVGAVKEALLLKGPLSVSIDGTAKDLRFYHSGIYDNPDCKTDAEDLSHAVVLSGYGEEDGVGFWIVKNIWSPLWGEAGYIRVRRSPNDCGIATAAQFAEIDEAATARRMRDRSPQ